MYILFILLLICNVSYADTYSKKDDSTLTLNQSKTVDFTYDQIKSNIKILTDKKTEIVSNIDSEIEKWQALLVEADKLGLKSSASEIIAEPLNEDPLIIP